MVATCRACLSRLFSYTSPSLNQPTLFLFTGSTWTIFGLIVVLVLLIAIFK